MRVSLASRLSAITLRSGPVRSLARASASGATLRVGGGDSGSAVVGVSRRMPLRPAQPPNPRARTTTSTHWANPLERERTAFPLKIPLLGSHRERQLSADASRTYPNLGRLG